MKWFWYSLIVFCLLMCSCKTQKSAHLINEASKENIHTEWSKFQTLLDTTNIFRVGIDKSNLKIIETIKITEYDAQSGKPIKETEAKRETTQDSDKIFAEEEQKRVDSSLTDSLKHIAKVSKKIDSEVTEESIGGQEAFGKWFGIVIGVIVGILLLYLLRKFRVS